MEMPGTQNIQNNPKKQKENNWRTYSDFKNYYKTIVIKTI